VKNCLGHLKSGAKLFIPVDDYHFNTDNGYPYILAGRGKGGGRNVRSARNKM